MSVMHLWEFELTGAKAVLGVYGSSKCSRKDISPLRGTLEASTSSAPRPPVPEAVSFPEETDRMYRWFVFQVDAPPRGASRPTHVM